MKTDEKLFEQIKKVEYVHRKHLESKNQMIEDIKNKEIFVISEICPKIIIKNF